MSPSGATRGVNTAVTLALLGLVVVVFAPATSVLAEQGTVTTKDGQRYAGDVREEQREVIVASHGVETIIPRTDVASILYAKAYEADFRSRLSKLAPTDVPGRIELAREAFDEHRYELSREALNSALQIDANSREATDMLDLVERQVRLERAAAAGEPEGARAVQPPRAAPAPSAARRLLTPDDINTIRQHELQTDDTGVRISFQGDVRKRYAEQNNMTFAEFNRLAPIEQARRILKSDDPAMRRQVRITSDPSSLAEYKRRVQPLVLSQCATSGCHGGSAGGDFVLHSPADSDAVAYTNFYILQQYQRRVEGRPGADAGMFQGSVRKMIERGHGDVSLLANFGLPVSVAEYDHPEVGGKPVLPAFRNRQDRQYRQIVDWMDESLLRIEPDYEIDFPLPGSTQPATGPSR